MAKENTSRDPRDTMSREKSARAVYVPPTSLPDPTPEPGYLFRWVATHVLGQSDPTNVSRKMREGWEPVIAEQIVKLLHAKKPLVMCIHLRARFLIRHQNPDMCTAG